jgi:hypothetical protein
MQASLVDGRVAPQRPAPTPSARIQPVAHDAHPLADHTYQANYFVVESFQQLFEATAPDFAPLYAQLRELPEIDAGVVLPGEREFGPAPSPSGKSTSSSTS